MRSHSKAFIAVAALFALLLVPSSALAAKRTELVVPTGGSPGGIAVSSASGDVYVQISDGDRVERYDEDGNPLGQFGEPGNGNGQFSFFGSPVQLAIDQTDGAIYVPDPGNNRVQKFEADGTFVGQLGPEVTGNGELFSPQGVTVNPNTGDVFVVDSGNKRVLRFSSTGVFEATVLDESDFENPFTSPGVFDTPRQVAIDSTRGLYILDAGEQIRRFTPSGALDVGFGSKGFIGRDSGSGDIEPQFDFQARSIGFDLAKDHLLVFAKSSEGERIYEIDETGATVELHGVGISAPGEGVTASVDGERYLVAQGSSSRYLVLTDAGAPPGAVSIDSISGVTDSEATFTGTVNPNGGFETSWRFEYSSDGGTTWKSSPGGSAGNGTADVPVTDTVTGLEPSQDYLVRLVATKAFGAGSAVSSTLSFTTDAVPPVVEALEPGPATGTTAWLGAFVNPRNSQTDFYVEYSTDPGFATSISVPASQDAPAGSGNVRIVANQLVKGLQPSTTYHYQVVATNEAGTATGESRSFTTLASDPPLSSGLPDGRVWEKVSPAFKNGANIGGGNFFNGVVTNERSQAAIEGDAVAFGSKGKFAGAAGAPAVSAYISRRGSGGWSTEAVNPPMDPMVSLSDAGNFFQWFSEDLSHGLVTTHAALNLGDPKDVLNLYLRNNRNGSFSTISNGDASTQARATFVIQGVSRDNEHFIFKESSSSGSVLMDRRIDGDLSPVSVLPDDAVVTGYLGSGDFPSRMSGFNAVSEDGSRIFFSTDMGGGGLYVRTDGASTTLVSASERSGDDAELPRNADFLAASTDGSVAFFRSDEALTDSSIPGEGSCAVFEDTGGNGLCRLYRWDANAPAGERLTDLTVGDPQGAHALGVVGLSDDGSSVYFVATGDLDGNGSRSQPNLYLWRQGEEGVRFVSELLAAESGESSDWGLWSRGSLDVEAQARNDEPYRPARVTPDGRYLAFSTRVPQTGYDTNGKRAIYIFDSETGRTICVSCGSVEPKSKGDSWFVSCASEGASETRCLATTRLLRNFRDDGKRLIFDSKDALVPADTNGVTDVYEWQEGRLHLLSSGISAFPSRFVDASADGDDVFFTTAQQLTPSDQDDLRDLYDARVGGVLEPSDTPPCVADECQGTPLPPPPFRTPSSSGFEGAGNAAAPRPRCGKAKVRRKGRCVKRKARKQARGAKNRRADHNRRAGR